METPNANPNPTVPSTGLSLDSWLAVANALDALDPYEPITWCPAEIDGTPAAVYAGATHGMSTENVPSSDVVLVEHDAAVLVEQIDSACAPNDPDDMVGWALVIFARWETLDCDERSIASDYIEAAYWFCAHNYRSQWGPRYAALCFLMKGSTYRNEPDQTATHYADFHAAEAAR